MVAVVFFPPSVYRTLRETTMAYRPYSGALRKSFERHVLGRTAGPAVCIVDMNRVRLQHRLWEQNLPNVRPHYAVKCNPDRQILKMMNSELDVGVDCAGINEISLCQDRSGGVYFRPEDVILANPMKAPEDLKRAHMLGINLMTADCVEELYKIKQCHPAARVILRLQVDDTFSLCRFSEKFGTSVEDLPVLFETLNGLGLDAAGVSFHVGSGCKRAVAYDIALRTCRKAFDIAHDHGFTVETGFDVLNVGGGFPGYKLPDESESADFVEVAGAIRRGLKEYFPKHAGGAEGGSAAGLKLMAEPGRFYVASSHTLYTTIVGKKRARGGEAYTHYYINDGTYGSFNCIEKDHVQPRLEWHRVHESTGAQQQKLTEATVWGPTCDSLDCVQRNVLLPDLEVGDLLVAQNMGAYTTSAGVAFNGFPKPEMVYIDEWQTAADSENGLYNV